MTRRDNALREQAGQVGGPLDSLADGSATEVEEVGPEPSAFADRRRLAKTLVAVVVLVVAIYLLFPKLVGLEGAFRQLGQMDPLWLGVGLVFCFLTFASYVALFRGVVGEDVLHLEWRESYQITMANLAATRVFSAAGAGGIVLTYWALRKAGMRRRRAACRMVAFMALLYAVYMLAVLISGILLRNDVLAGPSPLGLTVVPAALAGGVIALLLLVALLPDDFENRLAELTHNRRFGGVFQRLGSVPATVASGIRTAIDFVRNPSRGGLAIFGAVGFWAANIGILWAAFHGFSVEIPLGVVVQGFFIGMVANLIPAPGGVGAVDAGMIGTFVLFGYPGSEVFAAILVYRLIAFWLPIPPGIVAFFQLRRTVARWDREGRSRSSATHTVPDEALAAARRGSPITS